MLKKEILVELYNFYTCPPFLSYAGLSEHAFEKFGLETTWQKIRRELIALYPDINKTRRDNKYKLSLSSSEDMSREYMLKLYKKATELPIPNCEELSEFAKNKFGVAIKPHNIINIIKTYYPDVAERRKSNRKNVNLLVSSVFSEKQIEQLYQKATNIPFLTDKELCFYAKAEYGISINPYNMKKVMQWARPEIVMVRNKRKRSKEAFAEKSGKKILSNDKKVVIEMLKSGYRQIDIAEKMGVTQSCINKISQKAGVNKYEVNKAKALNRMKEYARK